MALSYVGGTSAVKSDGSSPVLDLTALTGGTGGSPLEGDIVVVGTGFSQIANGDPGVSTAGYTEIADLYQNDSQDSNVSANYKAMGATPDTSVTCNGSGSSDYGSVAVCQVWRNADTTTPMDVAATTAGGTDTGVPNPPSITPATSGAVVIVIAGGTAAADATPTAPSGYGNLIENCASGAILYSPMAIASKAWSGAGAEDPGTFGGFPTGIARSWNAVTIALRLLVTVPTVDMTVGAWVVAGVAMAVQTGLQVKTSDVKEGVVYGPTGTEFTGTYAAGGGGGGMRLAGSGGLAS